ncbi:methyltransferase domain-containing protein [Ramlibacter montanisoli]|uniref:Class I SAM-dependent methyltransferase n=1 Tax=Ramlibacter montanisoli TaxID=2732512 RepID=A0A849KEG3_9BURK|nr:methyltransferase domain-containing protein [Ramlibacter montanisoli]NNU43091.1 class I SAM-dependent methyltransferase [Ramlibacter montanisoli]
MAKSEPTRHLDLGCGETPRNPYGRDQLCGVDIVVPAQAGACEIRRANLAIEPIPYEDASFDSVSAYDFFEHVPRVLLTADGRSTRFPFIELMNEVWRVLKPGGLLYASMPCYPSEQAFQDPTHVNFLTISSHEYFTQPALAARMYGFVGRFATVRVIRHSPRGVYEPMHSGWRHDLRRWNRARRGDVTHLLWEFTAVK